MKLSIMHEHVHPAHRNAENYYKPAVMVINDLIGIIIEHGLQVRYDKATDNYLEMAAMAEKQASTYAEEIYEYLDKLEQELAEKTLEIVQLKGAKAA